MRLLKIFEAGEFFVKVLGQVENLLGNIEYLLLAHLAYVYEACDDLGIDQLLLLKLLTDFQSDVNGTDCQEGRMADGEGHFMH